MISKDILEDYHKKGFNENEIYNAYKIFFGTLVSKSRLKIINLLRKKNMNVSEIINELKINQTAASHDLSRLKKCGFVKVKVNGKYRDYALNKQTIMPLMELIEKHMTHHCIHILKENKIKRRNTK